MTSPKTLDFPLPPRRGSNPSTSEIRSPPPVSFPGTPTPQQQQLARILELTNRYRTQTVTLLARHEALQAEQKNVFDLERQLWSTEREIWEEERRLLTAGLTTNVVVNGEKAAHDPAVSIYSPTGQLNQATRFLSVSSMAESVKGEQQHQQQQQQPQPLPVPEPVPNPGMRKRDSSVGGVRLGWYMKHGLPVGAEASGTGDNISPKGSGRGKGDSPRYGSTSEVIDEEAVDAEDFDITPSLLAEAAKLVYTDKSNKRASFSSNSTTTKRGAGIPTLFKTLAEPQDSSAAAKAVRRVSSSVYPGSRTARYLNQFTDDEVSDDDRDTFEHGSTSQPPKTEKKTRKRSASHSEKANEEPPVPLRLRPSSNFGTAFGSVRGNQQMLAPPAPPRQGSMSSSTFYHPETPVDSFNSQHSFREASWTARNMPKLSENSVGGDSMRSNRTIKSPTEPTNVKSAPWGVTSTSITSPTFGASDIPQGLKPSPSNLTSSLSISSSLNSPVGRPPSEKGVAYSSSSRYSTDGISEMNIHVHSTHNYSSTNSNNNTSTSGDQQQKGKTSPPTYTWNPPPPLPTSPSRSASSSRKSGLYGTALLLSPSTVAPSTKTNPRLSAVGGIMPRSPPLGRMGTSSMLLSVSSKSENGDDDEDLLEQDEHEMEMEAEEKRVAALASRVKSPELRTDGANGGAKGRLAEGFNEAPVEIIRESRWANVLPGGMI
ncbi:hypothetical protein TWF696_003825 [Orbilia brochopaga]|uniref:Uncharacterized protein n=1 Tax=Orbilia brochopaga TaxID=3140254 RepID=A0AAV9V489_9PEZI